jgi:hypothetical protein
MAGISGQRAYHQPIPADIIIIAKNREKSRNPAPKSAVN